MMKKEFSSVEFAPEWLNRLQRKALPVKNVSRHIFLQVREKARIMQKLHYDRANTNGWAI
jgi:hypothetical protein